MRATRRRPPVESNRNPKGEILQKTVQELCRGHDEKEPLQPGFRNVVGHWASGLGL